MIYLKLQHLNPHLLLCQMNFIILLNAVGQMMMQIIKAMNQFPQFFIGDVGVQAVWFIIFQVKGIDLLAKDRNGPG